MTRADALVNLRAAWAALMADLGAELSRPGRAFLWTFWAVCLAEALGVLLVVGGAR